METALICLTAFLALTVFGLIRTAHSLDRKLANSEMDY